MPRRTRPGGCSSSSLPIARNLRRCSMPPPTAHARRHPAQHPRKPRLVHRLHALSGRDFPGPARGAAQFPDDRHRSHRPRDRQRLDARRGHRRRRGHDDVPPPQGRRRRRAPHVFFVSENCHPQTIDIVKTRAKPLGVDVVVGDHRTFAPAANCFGVLVQYPDTTGSIHDFADFFAAAHAAGAFTIVATDLLALTLLRAPGEFGADVAVGSAQRFGVPMGFGGPHAGFLATKDAFKRQMPGRLVGVSKDAQGNPAMRLALGTREQHIRRDKATSNICTAQVLLAVMASMYAVYHGPEGLKKIARRVKLLTGLLADGLTAARRQGQRRAGLRHAHRRQRRRRARPRRRRREEIQPPPRRRLHGRHLARRDDDRRGRADAALRFSATSARLTPIARRSVPIFAAPRRAHASAFLTPPRSSTATTPSTRCCATSAGSRRRTSRSATR